MKSPVEEELLGHKLPVHGPLVHELPPKIERAPNVCKRILVQERNCQSNLRLAKASLSDYSTREAGESYLDEGAERKAR